MPLRQPLLVMGVSGSGKSTVGAALAREFGVPFVEGDDLHPAANVAKMAAGHPLTDEDRAPWLDAVAARLTGGPVVVACSALRERYRDRLRRAAPDLGVLYLRGDREVLEARLARRAGHFMPVSLLDSQLATLEEPGPDEGAIVVDIEAPVESIVAAVVAVA